MADLEEIESNDFNLNISRYVDTTEPVEVMSVEEALAQLRDAERRRDEAVAKMDAVAGGVGVCQTLGRLSGSWSVTAGVWFVRAEAIACSSTLTSRE